MLHYMLKLKNKEKHKQKYRSTEVIQILKIHKYTQLSRTMAQLPKNYLKYWKRKSEYHKPNKNIIIKNIKLINKTEQHNENVKYKIEYPHCHKFYIRPGQKKTLKRYAQRCNAFINFLIYVQYNLAINNIQ